MTARYAPKAFAAGAVLIAACGGPAEGFEGAEESQATLVQGGATGELVKSSDWGSGYCAVVKIANSTNEQAASWSLTADTTGVAVTSSWNATTTTNGSALTFKPLAAYEGLAAGASTTGVGFCANGSKLPAVTAVRLFRADGSAIDDVGGTGGSGGSAGASSSAGSGGVSEGGTSGATSTCQAVTYEAESMSKTTGGAAPPGWNVWSNGSVFTSHGFSSGTAKISVVAKGQSANGVWPTMVVEVGGKQVGSATVGSSSYATYDFKADVTGGSQELRIKFTNDLKTYYEDRNLFVDKVTVACDGGVVGTGGSGGTGGSAAGGSGGSGGEASSSAALPTCRFNYGQDWQGASHDYPDNLTYVRAWIGGDEALGSHVKSMLDGCKDAGVLAGRTPMMIGYVIAYTARADAGLQDCDVADKAGLSTSLCTNGTKFIRDNEAKLLQKHRTLARNIAAAWGKTKPVLWLTEPDYFQYAKDEARQVGGGFSYVEAGSYLRKFLSAVKDELPNVVFALDTAPWLGGRAEEWFRAMPMDLMSYVAAYGAPTERIQNNQWSNTWKEFHDLTGKPLLSEGWSYDEKAGNWHSVSTINQLISWGVVSESFRTPPSNWNVVAAANAPSLNKLVTCK